ncbi:MAG: hypothetical protein JNL60_12870 [Bacteroidia bacterium]|nr:hypothetical protein [Bacteroidia bacterium]
MKTKLILAIIATCILSSCTKEYNCVCSNPGGVFETHVITGTQMEAQQQCNKISQQYASVPMSETYCELK